jgi:hypothetical protein
MHHLRTRKSLVLFGIGVVVFAAFLPGVSSGFTAVLTPLWIVLPAIVIVAARPWAAECDEQPVSLLSLLLSRAPPEPVAFA